MGRTASCPFCWAQILSCLGLCRSYTEDFSLRSWADFSLIHDCILRCKLWCFCSLFVAVSAFLAASSTNILYELLMHRLLTQSMSAHNRKKQCCALGSHVVFNPWQGWWWVGGARRQPLVK